eukprot:96324_1
MALEFIPGTKHCRLNKDYEIELLYNITNYGLWNHLPIYADYVSIHDIIKYEKKKWKRKHGNDSISYFPNYIVTNHFGAYCIFSRDFFPIYFHVASSFGLNNILFVLLESRSPWYFSTRQSVTGIPDIRLYQIDKQNKGETHHLLGQYVTSGQRSYDGFRYWLEKYTKLDNTKPYPLLISKPLLHKDVNKNKNYYKSNYQMIKISTFYNLHFGNDSNNSNTLRPTQFNADTLIQASSFIEDELIGYISTGLSLLFIIVTLITWIRKCYNKLFQN